MGKTLIFTATYNERDNVEDLINQINYNSPQSDILVIDNKSRWNI